jgi:hypothetical protein
MTTASYHSFFNGKDIPNPSDVHACDLPLVGEQRRWFLEQLELALQLENVQGTM